MKEFKKGKNRTIYDIGNDKFVIVTCDNVSTDDTIFPKKIPRKGEVSNKMSEFWFDFTKEIFPNHMISTKNSDMPKEFQEEKYRGRCMLVKKTQLLPVKCIVYGYFTGDLWEKYQENNTVYDIEFYPGIGEAERLGTPVFLAKVTSEDGKDEYMTFKQVVELVGEELATKIKSVSIELYEKCAEYAKSKWIIIADTQFRFGIDSKGNLMLASELITSDSSRFWPAEEYLEGRTQNSYDKQYLISWLKSTGWNKGDSMPDIPARIAFETSAQIIKAYEQISGKTFY